MLVTNKNSQKKYYKALVEKDSAYIGLFYAGVKTTGIFCIPTCRARKPKFENVEFFTEMNDALQNGYRPCKICKPTENAYETPEPVQKALSLLKASPKEKIKDENLRQNGIQPEKVRRWFQKHYGITFQAYQRMLRINNAFQELQNGNSVTDSAFGIGYESLSGFGYTFKRMIGSSPETGKHKNVILITRFTTPLGPMYACATEQGVCLLEFADRKILEKEFSDLQRRLDAIILAGENQHLAQLKIELEEYFAGQRQQFEVSLHTPGTEFQQAAWRVLHSIPYGKTASYQQQAIKLENPNAVRAVAAANGQNRIAIIIPCHRVIGKNGKLTGYGGGLERKKWLLEHEQSKL
ncbi:MAG: methylated-DNA--[protein]-cysteine S-methyltransferase [Bacteroidota bacterium]